MLATSIPTPHATMATSNPAEATVSAMATVEEHGLRDVFRPMGVTPKETFEVKEGANAFDAKDANIGDYVEFHIHVGTSAVTLYKASIEPPAKK